MFGRELPTVLIRLQPREEDGPGVVYVSFYLFFCFVSEQRPVWQVAEQTVFSVPILPMHALGLRFKN